MEVKMGDTIYIKGFKNENPEFYCLKHMKDLIGFPTRVFLIRNGEVYVTHPILDLVPFSEDCVDYEIIEDINLGYHTDLKKNQQLVKQMGMKKIPQKHIKKIFKNLNEEEEKPALTGFQNKLIKLITLFQNGDVSEEDIENAMGSFDKFFELIIKYNLSHYIDPFNNDWSDYQNKIIYQFIQKDPNYIYKIMEMEFSDITEIDGKYYVDLQDSGELAQFFSSGRNDISEDRIAEILNGDYDGNFYDDVTNDEFKDVYEELEPKYQEEIRGYIKEELLKIGTLSIGNKTPELIEDLAKEQGDESNLKLNEEIITQLLQDNDCVEYFIMNSGLDIQSELYSLYSNCYGSVYVNELYDSIIEQLVGEVIDNKKAEDYKYKKHDYSKNTFTERYGVRYEVTKTAHYNIKLWFEANVNNPYENLNYYGGYINLLKSLFDNGDLNWLSSGRTPDYPDFSEVEKCLNIEFNSYF